MLNLRFFRRIKTVSSRSVFQIDLGKFLAEVFLSLNGDSLKHETDWRCFMVTISLCMIVKNEEGTLSSCLDSIRDVVDEIIIVDTGSTDATKEEASKYTDLIFDFEWIDNFSAARNFAFEKATMDYIMWLDADDIILSEDKTKLLELKKSMPAETDAVMMKYNTGFDRDGNVTFSYFRERLSRRKSGFKWMEPVHEYLQIGGRIVNTDICVTHAKKHAGGGGRNLRIYENLLAKGEELSPRGMYYYARELKDNAKYDEAARWFSAFLDSEKGWIEDNIASCSELARCYLEVKRPKEAMAALMRSFEYDTPRGEICCQIGYYFMDGKNYRLAAFWFGLVLSLTEPKDSWGFIKHDCWGYIPSIECAVCYDKLGEYEKAARYNEQAALYKPDSPQVLHNKRYFEDILNKA